MDPSSNKEDQVPNIVDEMLGRVTVPNVGPSDLVYSPVGCDANNSRLAPLLDRARFDAAVASAGQRVQIKRMQGLTESAVPFGAFRAGTEVVSEAIVARLTDLMVSRRMPVEAVERVHKFIQDLRRISDMKMPATQEAYLAPKAEEIPKMLTRLERENGLDSELSKEFSHSLNWLYLRVLDQLRW